MAKGDSAFVYHTGAEKALVGTAAILTDPYPDPRAKDPKLVVVDIGPGQRFPRPLSLSEIKADGRFAAFDLVKNSRLSVMPVPAPIWKALLGLASRSAEGR
jgi:predicted RNA-binding protein with PUA-like domain